MHRIDGAGHVDHMFVAEDPDTFRPPTEVTADFLNALQEELAAVIEWAEVELAKGSNAQLRDVLLGRFAQLNSPAFLGNPRAPTADLGDASETLANTEFVHLVVAALGLDGFAQRGAQNVFTAGNCCAEKPLPAPTGTVTLDFDDGVNFGGQLTGNIVLANPTGLQPGKSGVIRIKNDVATPRTIAYGSIWKSPGGAMPALTAAAGATDVFGYYVESVSRITLIQQPDSK